MPDDDDDDDGPKDVGRPVGISEAEIPVVVLPSLSLRARSLSELLGAGCDELDGLGLYGCESWWAPLRLGRTGLLTLKPSPSGEGTSCVC